MQNIEAGGAAFKLSLTDDLTRDIREVMSNAKDVVVNTVREIDSEIKKLGRAIASIGKKMVAAGAASALFGAGALAAFTKATFAAGDFAEVVTMFNAVFKEQSHAVGVWAKNYAREVKRSEQLTMRFLAEAQDTFVPLGFDRQEAAELSKTVTALAIDLSSFKNISEDDALRRLLGALVGVTQNLRAFGVVAQEAQIKAKALDLGFDPNNLTSYQKALAILEITLDGTKDAQGDAKRTADGFKNSIRGLKAAIEELVLSIGEPLREFGAGLARFLTTVVQGLADFAKDNPGAVKFVAGMAAVLSVLAATVAAAGAVILGLGVRIAALGVLVLIGKGAIGSLVSGILTGLASIAAMLTRTLSFALIRAAIAGIVATIVTGVKIITAALIGLGRIMLTSLLNPWVLLAVAIVAATEALKRYYAAQEAEEKKKGEKLENERQRVVSQSFRDAGQAVPADLGKTLDVNNAKVVGERADGSGALSNAQQDLAMEIQRMRTPLETFRDRMADALTLFKRGTINKQQYGKFAQQEHQRLRDSNPDNAARESLIKQLRTPTEVFRDAVKMAARLFKDDSNGFRRAVAAARENFRMTDKATQLAEALRTPLERMHAAILEARQLFADDPENLRRAIADAKATFEASKKDDPNQRVADGIRDSLKSEAKGIAEDIGKAFELVTSGDLSMQDAKAYAKSIREKFLGGDLDAIKSAPNFQGLATRSASVAANIGKFAPTFDNMESETKAYRKKALTLADETRKELRRLRRKGVVFGA